MAITVRKGSRFVFDGDSITAAAWMSVSGGLIDQINAQIPSVTTVRPAVLASGARGASVSGSGVVSVAAATSSFNIFVQNSGHAGDFTSDISSNVATRITNYNPDIVVLLIGINDIINSVPQATIHTNYNSILSQIRSWSSTVQIACLSILVRGEQWAAGPVWSNSPSFDGAIDTANADISALCTTYSATYIDVRAQLLTYESTHNTPAPGSQTGILFADVIHPNATGQLQIGNAAIGSFSVQP